MKYLMIFFATVLSVSSPAQQKEEEAVKNCFAQYKAAILESDGAGAQKWVDQNTLDYYQKMLKLAISADSATVAEASFMDRMTIFTARHRIPANEALAMQGDDFFIYAIDEGMVGKNSVMNVDIGTVKVEGNFATGQLQSGGQPAPFSFHFYKKDGGWKVDLTSLFNVSNKAMKQMAAGSGMSENDFIFHMLEILTGSRPGVAVWRPLKEIRK